MVTMTAKRDYYEVLGVARTASAKEIAEAYRKLALKYHPDRNPDDPEAVARFKEASEAFEVLNDTQRRELYDRYGHAGLERGGAAPQYRDVEDIFDAFSDIFGEDIFGGLFGRTSRGGRRRMHRGRDVQCEVTLTLHEAARGATKTVAFDRHEPCATCHGSGARPGSQPEPCGYCGGQGRILQGAGFIRVQTTCPACRGAGTVVRDPCRDCGGSGLQAVRATRDLKVPAGVDDGAQLRVAGGGDPSPNGGPPGDFYCTIRVKEHPLFHRHGPDLLCRIPITYPQAALGAEIEIPTLDGRETLRVPPGTQSGAVFKFAGAGLPIPGRRGQGDLLVEVFIEVPQSVTPEQEQLLRQLAALEHKEVSPQRKSFFEKVKAYFVSDLSQTDAQE